MKKILSAIVCFCLIVSCFSAYGAEMVEAPNVKEKIAVVKSRIGSTDEYPEFNSNVINYNNGDCVYNFVWENTNPHKYLQISINQNNIITNYYKSNGGQYSQNPLFVYKPQDEIIEAAKSWFFALNPDIADEFVFETQEYTDLYSNTFTVNFKRFKNGVEVIGNNGTITLSKDLNDVTGMWLNYDSVAEFESIDSSISLDDAKQSFADKLGYKLCYTINYTTGEREAQLKYIANYDYSKYIDALNGEVFDFAEYNYSDMRGMQTESTNDKLASGSGSVTFSEAEISEITNILGLLDINVVEKELKNNKYLQIPADSKMQYSRVSRDYYDKGKYVYRFEFKNDNENIYVSVNAHNGLVLNFSRHSIANKETNSKISLEKLYEIQKNAAKNLAKDYFTDDIHNTLKFIENEEKTSSLRAVRIVNDVEVMGNGLSIGVNEYTGKIVHYSLEWFDIDFPEVSNAISIEHAYDELFKKGDYHLSYLPVVKDKAVYTGKLVYNFGLSNVTQDALTGKLDGYVEEKEKITDYNDISGHYAEDLINKLKSFGIGFTGGEFKPDENITQGEFLTLLAYVFRRGVTPVIYKSDNDFSMSYAFVRASNLLPDIEIDENAEVTREKACVVMIKAMGFDEIADLSPIYVTTFNDVKDNIGYIAILNGMNIVSGDGNGNFNPDKPLTRAEAAVLLYNYLTK